jgi:hypothetical protein
MSIPQKTKGTFMRYQEQREGKKAREPAPIGMLVSIVG